VAAIEIQNSQLAVPIRTMNNTALAFLVNDNPKAGMNTRFCSCGSCVKLYIQQAGIHLFEQSVDLGGMKG
jgi:hypothetical protein